MANGENKFESESLPIILATIQQAREAAISGKQRAEIIIHLSENGGMDYLQRRLEKRVK